jgi:hypothetical protein
VVSPERKALAEAIAARDEAGAELNVLTQARERARHEAFRARREVEDAERTLTRVRDEARVALVNAYVGGDDTSSDAIADAEKALAQKQRRAAELMVIEHELDARAGPAPGHSLPSKRVEAAVRDVVKGSPVVRRLVEDFRWLASLECIPDDLKEAAPKAHDTYYAPPDVAWAEAIRALQNDADASLPE